MEKWSKAQGGGRIQAAILSSISSGSAEKFTNPKLDPKPASMEKGLVGAVGSRVHEPHLSVPVELVEGPLDEGMHRLVQEALIFNKGVAIYRSRRREARATL